MRRDSPPPTHLQRGQVERPGATIHYQLTGEGRPCLLLQGVGVRGEAWQPQMEAFKTNYALCSVDNRGIGASTGSPSSIDEMAQDALGVLDALGWERAHVVGHSMGGAIAMSLAARHPDRVSSLALMCTVARGMDIFSLSPRVLATQFRTRVGSKGSRRRAFFELVSCSGHASSDEASLLELEQAFGRRLEDLPRVVSRQVLAFSRFSSRPLWPALSAIRTLVLSADEDSVCPPKSGEKLARGIEGAQFELIRGGHAVPVQDAETVNEALRRFWTQSPPRLDPS